MKFLPKSHIHQLKTYFHQFGTGESASPKYFINNNWNRPGYNHRGATEKPNE